MASPRHQVTVVAQRVVFGRPPGRAVLGVDQVEREVASDDALSSDVRWCFHQNAV